MAFHGIIVRHSNFNPRPPCGGRQPFETASGSGIRFQSTSSVWRTTTSAADHRITYTISIHVLRVEDDGGGGVLHQVRHISIHVLRVEDD